MGQKHSDDDDIQANQNHIFIILLLDGTEIPEDSKVSNTVLIDETCTFD